MSGLRVALLDANVLYPTTLRDLLMWLAVTKTYDAHWTERIQNEWTCNLLSDQPQLSEQQLERTKHLMDQALPGALVTGYEDRIDDLELPDTDDRHVLAAAIHSEAQIIVTLNLRDFPSSALEPYGIQALHPDDFALALTERDPDGVLRAVSGQRGNFKQPPLTRAEYLERLRRQGLTGSRVGWRRTCPRDPRATLRSTCLPFSSLRRAWVDCATAPILRSVSGSERSR